ncbi:MAG TPA: cbb3-type cytochrome c oxidase subunit 3 [Parvularculaceae bacterium]|nr:cbb3-type cytochrome c oxidase subunit 3 [Parvularculaceae bacterium]
MTPTYEQVAHFAQIGGLVLFIVAFALVLIYALSPANRKKFEEARRIPLEEDDND